MSRHRAASDELKALFTALGADTDRCIKVVSEDDSQFARRQLVRSAFAMHDGVTYALKQLALALHDEGDHVFAPGELSILAELTYDLDDKGRVTGRAANLPALKNIRFAFSAYGAANGIEFALPVGDHAWEKFCRAVKVRNRLMHPKSSSDLDVADSELADVLVANKWFGMQLISVAQAVNDALVAKTQALTAERAAISAANAELSVTIAELEHQNAATAESARIRSAAE